MIREEVINSIDNINSVVGESEISVIESMIDFFDKSFMIMENSDVLVDDVSFFQEAKKEKGILDKVKDKGKKDSNKFVTILWFIPRLISAIVDSIKNVFKGDDLGERVKEIGKNLNKSNDLKEKESRVEEFNKTFEGQCECYVDEKSGKIKFKKDNGEGLLSKLTYFTDLSDGALELFGKVKSQFDPNDPGKIRSLVDDCNKFLKRDPSVEKFDLFEGGIEALGEVIGTCNSTAKEISLLNDGIQNMTADIVRKDMIKDMPNEKKQEVMKNINELSGKIKQISVLVAGSVGGLRVFKSWGEKICAVKHKVDAEDDNKMAYLYECTAQKYIKTDFKNQHPQQHMESDEDYEKRFRKIRNAAVDELFDKNPDIKEKMFKYAEEHYKGWKKESKKANKKK